MAEEPKNPPDAASLDGDRAEAASRRFKAAWETEEAAAGTEPMAPQPTAPKVEAGKAAMMAPQLFSKKRTQVGLAPVQAPETKSGGATQPESTAPQSEAPKLEDKDAGASPTRPMQQTLVGLQAPRDPSEKTGPEPGAAAYSPPVAPPAAGAGRDVAQSVVVAPAEPDPAEREARRQKTVRMRTVTPPKSESEPWAVAPSELELPVEFPKPRSSSTLWVSIGGAMAILGVGAAIMMSGGASEDSAVPSDSAEPSEAATAPADPEPEPERAPALTAAIEDAAPEPEVTPAVPEPEPDAPPPPATNLPTPPKRPRATGVAGPHRKAARRPTAVAPKPATKPKTPVPKKPAPSKTIVRDAPF